MTLLAAFRVASQLAAPVSVILLCSPARARAQRITGELSGTVADSQGGVVPGADVALANDASGATRRTVTNNSGFFAFAAVPAGTYTLTVTMPGFRTHEVTGIELVAGDSRTVRTIALQLAVVAERVSVSADVALTPLNSGEKTATLTGDEIRTMPVVGTSAAEVLRVLPGMTPITGGNNTNRPSFTGEVYGINGNGEYQGGSYTNNQTAVGSFVPNGTREGTLDLTIDGASGNDPGCNCATSVNPNTEFVQELKVLQSNFAAEHAKGPVALSFVSKQGGRDFHGSVFAQLRDWHLNSNEWYANKVGAERVKNLFLYPGFTLSGPLLVPGTRFNRGRDRVFFFLGFEYFRQRIDTGWGRSWVPTDAMRRGDFSQAADLGLTGRWVNTVPSGFPGGVVPSDLWDLGGKALLDLFPRPNADPARTGGYNYVDNFLSDQNSWQALGRVDVSLSEGTKLYARYNLQRERQPFSVALWGRWRGIGDPGRQTPYPSPVHGDNRSDSVTVALTHVFDPSLTSETVLAFTYIDFSNVLDNPAAASRKGVGYPYGGVFGQSQVIPAVDTSFFGQFGSNGPLYANYASFDPVLFATKWQWTAQQNVTKVWGTHTAKAGFFWEHVANRQPGTNQPGANDPNGLIGLAAWAWNSTGNTFADLLLGRVTYYDESDRIALHDIAYTRVEGFLQDSWKVTPRLTVDGGLRIAWIGPAYDRGGHGIVVWDETRYSPTAPAGDVPGMVWHVRDPAVPTSGVEMPVFVSPRLGFAWDTAGTGATVVRGGFGVYRYPDAPSFYGNMLDLAYGVRGFAFCCGTTLRWLEGKGAGDVVFGGGAVDRADDEQPRTLSWSLTLDRKLPWSTSLEIGYVGSKSDHQLNWGLSEYNPVPLGAMLDDPGGNADDYRPLSNYGNLQIYRHSAYQNYHALQALLSRQRGRFNFTASYTFSKSLGLKGWDSNGYRANASEYAFDPREYNYGVLGTDRTHVGSLSWSLQLPNVKRGGVWQALFGNWQLAGVSSYVSGAPLMGWFFLQGTTAGDVAITDRSITGSPDVYAMPVLVCDPRDGVPDGFLFNPVCFTAPNPGANGSARQPYIKGQPYYNTDLSLAKSFPLAKGSRLQLRVSAYNAFNHPIRYPDPARNLTMVFDNNVQTNAEFGRLPDDNKYGRRIVQVSARFEF
jgi:hypothetical protein